jgi:hypothetical protein
MAASLLLVLTRALYMRVTQYPALFCGPRTQRCFLDGISGLGTILFASDPPVNYSGAARVTHNTRRRTQYTVRSSVVRIFLATELEKHVDHPIPGIVLWADFATVLPLCRVGRHLQAWGHPPLHTHMRRRTQFTVRGPAALAGRTGVPRCSLRPAQTVWARAPQQQGSVAPHSEGSHCLEQHSTHCGERCSTPSTAPLGALEGLRRGAPAGTHATGTRGSAGTWAREQGHRQLVRAGR